jgi:hypothetical protein
LVDDEVDCHYDDRRGEQHRHAMLARIPDTSRRHGMLARIPDTSRRHGMLARIPDTSRAPTPDRCPSECPLSPPSPPESSRVHTRAPERRNHGALQPPGSVAPERKVAGSNLAGRIAKAL